MNPFAVVLALGCATVALLLTSHAQTPAVYACSAGEDFNPIAESDIIVGGWVTAWSSRPGIETLGDFTAIAVDIGVERVFKGRQVTRIQAVDSSSYTPRGPGGAWHGGSGACGSFDDDPRGMYAIVGLNLTDDGSYRMNRLLTFYIGDAPSGPDYEQAIARLTAPGAILPPATGSAGLASAAR